MTTCSRLFAAAAVCALACVGAPYAHAWSLDSWVTSADASYQGESFNDNSGFSLSPAGDVNGDGYDDFIIGSPNSSGGASAAGQTYLVLGGSGGWSMDQGLASVDASFLGEDMGDQSATAISAAGNVNGDSYDDFIIGAPFDDDGGSEAGQVYVILGSSGGWNMDTDLSNADASFIGESSGDIAGLALGNAGDVDGDGYDDFIIGAPQNSEGGAAAGQSYLILGGSGGWSMDHDLSTADASFIGESGNDWAGTAVTGAGDINNDSYDDLIIGAPGDDDGGATAGQTYVILGSAGGWSMDLDLSSADGSFRGESSGDLSGSAIAGAGDVDGDGYDDLLIGAYESDDGGSLRGQTYLIFGHGGAWNMDVDLSSADASFRGEANSDRSGFAVDGAGDVDGDGYDDLLIGAYESDDMLNNAGQTYLIFGASSGWSMNTSLGSSDASFIGEAINDGSGWAVAGAGDVNNDSYGDFLIAAPDNSAGDTAAGQSYLFLGGPECVDNDGDGYGNPGSAGCPNGAALDCDDTDAAINPDASEVCDYQDNDCDGLVDDDDPSLSGATSWYEDADGDGYGDALSSTGACFQPPGYVSDYSDCDDSDANTHPGAAEICDGEDNNCNGGTGANEYDVDGDGMMPCDGDCDDNDVNTYDGAPEQCDGLDNDCDGTVDENVGVDADGDGYTACAGDCDDGNANTHPGAAEICDGEDNNCNGGTGADEYDVDGDGMMPCDGDCDDNDDTVYDGATEICDGVDNDCDGAIDENGGANTYYEDADNDGYGDPGSTVSDCTQPAGYVSNDSDCDDGNAAVHPAAPEYCNNIDDDCDGLVDDADPDVISQNTWYADDDGDGYGDPGDTELACDQPAGHSSNGLDCDDGDATVHPGAPELCDGIDNDCDPGTDENADIDGDGYSACAGDCDDYDDTTYPGAPELCDGVDNDCDPATVEDDDEDGDGWTACDGDCNDNDPDINPDAEEICSGEDDNCDGVWDTNEVDNDGDGVYLCEGDCDDNDPDIYPGALEECDGIDNDCDDEIDEGTEDDEDGDGFNVCQGDCDDTDPETNPDAEEVCDGADNDCDGVTAEDEVDEDGDGWFVCDGDCDDTDPDLNLDDADGDGYSTCDDDCDDSDANTVPGDTEICGDGIDNNCDGGIDDADNDRDSHVSEDCGGDDCNDDNGLINPWADELCSDNVDNDCDGLVDAADPDCPEEVGGDCDCRIGGGNSPLVDGTGRGLLLALLGGAVWIRRRSR